MMKIKMVCRVLVGPAVLVGLLLVPTSSNAYDSHSVVSYQLHSGIRIPSVQIGRFSISSPYTLRRYRNHSYGNGYGHYRYSGYRGNSHNSYGRHNYGGSRHGYSGNGRGYQQGYNQGHRDGHSINKQWLHRKQREHRNSHGGHNSSHGSGFFSSDRGNHHGSRH